MLTQRNRNEERTGIQDSRPYDPRYDLQPDFVMVYGIDDQMPERIREYKRRGFIVQLMTGVAWGEYQDYLYGKFDGRDHWDEAQVRRDGTQVLHGPDVPYMVPTIAFTEYLTQKIKPAVDAGVDTIHLEEPELWVQSGYSEAFKREYLLYYREPWQPPHSSVDAQYRASKLKCYLYARALDRICSALKEYALVKYGRRLRFIVPTHSLLSYAQIHMCSPESALMDLNSMDGYIAQIWTGTSRQANVYRGKRQERVFEMGFLEYGIMQELVRGTNRVMWFLQDPIEDNPNYTWEYYQQAYLQGLTSALLHPHISQYEICPWPSRVLLGKYPRRSPEAKPIPGSYATTLLSTTQALRDMDQPYEWIGGDAGIGILVADSCMYQRMYPDAYTIPQENRERGYEPEFSSFFGLALPPLKQGLRVLPVQLDNVRRFAGYLNPYQVLILSYEYMKPEQSDLHSALSLWVRGGGVLIVVGDGSDPFHAVRGWWNSDGNDYASPTQHLLEVLELGRELEDGIYPCGKGVVAMLNRHPSEIAYLPELADQYLALIRQAMAQSHNESLRLRPKNYFALRRGPYLIAQVMEDSVSPEPLEIPGRFVNLYDHRLRVLNGISLKPGENILAADLARYPDEICLVGSAGRVEDFACGKERYTFTVRGTLGTRVALRFLSPRPTRVCATAGGVACSMLSQYDAESKTLYLEADGTPDGVNVCVEIAP